MVSPEFNRADGRTGQPLIASYDSGYEHSIEHLIFVRHLVERAIEDSEEPTIEQRPAIAV